MTPTHRNKPKGRNQWLLWQSVLAAGLIGALPAVGQSPARTARLQQLLDKLPDGRTRISAAIVKLPEGRILYQRSAEQALMPASNQKVVAAAAALHALGPSFMFETRLELRGNDLVLVGGGDPTLGDPRLAEQRGAGPMAVFESWAAELQRRGINSIGGDLLVNDALFEPLWVHPSWEPDDLPKWYAAPVGALNFNDNCIDFTLRPAKPNEEVAYETFPPATWITIRNTCKSGAHNTAWVHRDDPLTYSLRGETASPVTIPVPVADPGLFTARTLQAVLSGHGIEVRGQVRRMEPSDLTKAPGQAQVVATHRTPISDALQRALTDSQNLFAECLMKQTGSGTWGGGATAIEGMLHEWGLDTTGMVIADGSGLSRDNRISARQVVEILKHIYLEQDKRELFINSMAQAGTSGTLRRRMKDLPHHVWAKTGYLTGVRTLSGYVCSKDDQWFAFSVLFNDIPGGTAPYNKIHEEVCRALYAAD